MAVFVMAVFVMAGRVIQFSATARASRGVPLL